jgi:hypothetical protein
VHKEAVPSPRWARSCIARVREKLGSNSAQLQAYKRLEIVIFCIVDMESNGYATVASSIAQDPDKETYIFRRFDILTARNLLNLQGALLVLQDELDALDAKAASSPNLDLHLSMRSWKTLTENAKDPHTISGEEATKRLRIADDLEVKLRRYRKFSRIRIFFHEHPQGTATLRLANQR